MPSVTFFGGPMEAEFVCEHRPGEVPTVLELARRYDLPIYWRCGLGTCGACAARVTVLSGEVPPLGNKERNVLAREGKPAEPKAVTSWRLTCEYPLSAETLRVEW
jgi:ferredoxin